MIDFDLHFPRYTEDSPIVPIWCLTPHSNHVIHRFFDTSPLSPSGRYLAVFQLPDHDKAPKPGDRGNVVLVDLLRDRTNRIPALAGGVSTLLALLFFAAFFPGSINRMLLAAMALMIAVLLILRKKLEAKDIRQ